MADKIRFTLVTFRKNKPVFKNFETREALDNFIMIGKKTGHILTVNDSTKTVMKDERIVHNK